MAKKQGGQVIFEQRTQGELFAIVPESLAKDEKIGAAALRVYCGLCIKGKQHEHNKGPGYQGQEKLGAEFGGMSGRYVRAAISELVEAGYIETDRVGLGIPDTITIKRLP